MEMTEEQLVRKREYHRNYMKKRYHADPQKAMEATRAWNAKNKAHISAWCRADRKKWSPEKRAKKLAAQRAATFMRRYGLTQADYEAMLVKQSGHCALCPRTPDQERYKRLNVDHCHNSNVVRGLLCTPCNHAIGVLGDNEAGLVRALEYVRA